MNLLWLPTLPRKFFSCQSIDPKIVLEQRRHFEVQRFFPSCCFNYAFYAGKYKPFVWLYLA